MTRRLWRAHGVAEGGRHRPSDLAPLHLDLEARPARQLQRHSVEPGIAGLSDDRGVGGDEGTDLPDHLGPHELCIGLGGIFRWTLGSDARIFNHRCIALLDLSGECRKKVAQMDLTEIMPLQMDTF